MRREYEEQGDQLLLYAVRHAFRSENSRTFRTFARLREG